MEKFPLKIIRLLYFHFEMNVYEVAIYFLVKKELMNLN